MASDKSVNAGVHNVTGIDFQKHAILYLIFENFESLRNQKYFICVEHHDDFLFCYEEENKITRVDSYQAKKSSEKWGMSDSFIEIINKIIDTGIMIDDDEYPKKEEYDQNLYFLTNNAISLTLQEKNSTTGKAKTISDIVNETRLNLKIVDLKPKIKNKLISKLRDISNIRRLNKINNINLLYLDFAKTVKSQKHQLIGLFSDVFGDQVYDHLAAVDLLIEKFRIVESEFNQKSEPALLNYKKRVDSEDINETINLITSKKKAYDLWRSKKQILAQFFCIPVSKHSLFEMNFENSFDLFKDLKQSEHQKILEYVYSKKNVLDECFTDAECVRKIYSDFLNEINSTLNNIQIKAAVFAAYIELKDLV